MNFAKKSNRKGLYDAPNDNRARLTVGFLGRRSDTEIRILCSLRHFCLIYLAGKGKWGGVG